MLANIFQPLIDVAEAIVRFYHDTVGLGWGWAIVGLTVTVRLAILPLTFKQVRSMQAMQQLQPQMKELQKRYKDDRQRMNQELMKLYQEHSVNPLGSCLPLVLQLPFFLALFYLQQSEGFRALVRDTGGSLGVLAGGGSLAAAAQVKGGEKFLFIPDLTVAATGGVLIALIIIYITTQMGSSAVSASAMTDKNQKRLIFALPFLFTPFIISFPAGLLVYWITTNTWTIGQQLLVRKVLPPPHLKEAKEGEAKPEKPLGRLASMLAGAEGKAENRAHLGGGHKEGDGQATASGGAGAKASGGGRSKSPAGGADSGGKTGGRRGSGAAGARAGKGSGAAGARAGKGSGGGDGKTSGDGGNGRTQKAPPPSPRKKKKRSGRRR